MRQNPPLGPKVKSPKRLGPSILKDGVNPQDYMKFDLRFSCDDCSHFAHESEKCTLGYVAAHHRKEEQKRSYELSGRMALCRFLEID